ncbi:MAG: hypothetical protein WBY44_18265 [Bryobacteraceae bacterium]
MTRSCFHAVVFVATLTFVAKADITYDISRTIGTATVTGFIETDGNTGTLAITDIVDWNLMLTNQGATLNLEGPLSGSNSVDSDSQLDSDLTASATDLLFDFGAANAGYLLFQRTGLFGSGEQYYCDAATNQSLVCAAGEEIVPVSIFDPATYANTGSLTGTVIIASIPARVPEPTALFLASTMLMLIGVGLSTRKRSARALSRTARPTGL